MRKSRPREIILEELRKLKDHPRGDELYQIVRQRLPHLSLGTVYRNLDLLQRQGLIAELYCGDFNRYDGNSSPHDHFLCRSCHRMWDLETPPQPKSISATGSHFHIEGQYTVFYGFCPQCLSESERASP